MNSAESNVRVSGYLVVRVPETNFDEQGRGAFPASAPCVEGICYGGIDRMPWFDVEDELYSGNLPADLKNIHDAIKKSNDDFTGLAICTDFQAALQLLEYSNRKVRRNELIALTSPKLSEIKGSFELHPQRVEWLGYDIVSLGNWSLLREGFFVQPDEFKDLRQRLTSAGLLSDLEIATAYVQDYLAASNKGHVEELPESSYGIESIYVGRVVIAEMRTFPFTATTSMRV